MTGKERLTAILQKQPKDRLSWTTLVDSNTLDIIPEPLGGGGGLDFYRHLGCDIFLLNNWGLPHPFPRFPKMAWPADVRITRETVNGQQQVRCQTDRGMLTSITQSSHPVKPLVETLEDVKVYRYMWEGARFEDGDDRPAFAAAEQMVGDDGIVTLFPGPSAIPRLLEEVMGTMSFYYLMNDHPDEVTALIEVMHSRELELWKGYAKGPWEVAILCENTSTYYISPDIYRRFNGPHQKDFVDIMHAAGKVAIIHMCGHVKDLLNDIKAIGADGIHALTPPPTGNTPWELALDILGEDAVIIGGLDPSIFIVGPVDDIPRKLDQLYTPRLRKANFVLCSGADGIAVPIERFEAIKRWMQKNAS